MHSSRDCHPRNRALIRKTFFAAAIWVGQSLLGEVAQPHLLTLRAHGDVSKPKH